MKTFSILLIAVGILATSFTSGMAKPKENVTSETFYLYNFAKHINWNDDAEAFAIGIFASKDVFKQIKSSFSKKDLNGKRFEVIQLHNAAAANNYHMVYVHHEGEQLVSEIQALGLDNTLLVTQHNHIQDGAAISIVEKDNSKSFKVNLAALESANLEANQELFFVTED